MQGDEQKKDNVLPHHVSSGIPRITASYLLKLVKGPAKGFSEVGHAMGFESIHGIEENLLVTIIRLNERVETRHLVRIFETERNWNVWREESGKDRAMNHNETMGKRKKTRGVAQRFEPTVG